MRITAPETKRQNTGHNRAARSLDAANTPVPGSPAHVDQLVEEIVAAAPPFTPEQRRRLAELLSIKPVNSWPEPGTPRQAA
jgi:hypothetical protein